MARYRVTWVANFDHVIEAKSAADARMRASQLEALVQNNPHADLPWAQDARIVYWNHIEAIK